MNQNKTAFLFAGQGAQFVGMGADFFAGCSGEIYDLMREGPQEELNKTVNAQEAIFLHSLAAAEELRRRGVVPDCVAGFSLGEITALHFVGALDCTELLRVRAAAMQKCCEETPGAMVGVVKLTHEKVRGLVEALGRDDVWAANFNSPALTVCSCAPEAVEALSAAAAAAGGKGLRLRVSGAFHCPLMSRAAEAVKNFLSDKKLRTPNIPVYSNVTAKPYNEKLPSKIEGCRDSGGVSDLISTQITSPLLWQQTIENMLADGVRTFVEVGPGQELTGLVRRIVEAQGVDGVRIFNASDFAGIENIVKEFPF